MGPSADVYLTLTARDQIRRETPFEYRGPYEGGGNVQVCN
jgi:hypothetical protein